MQRQYLNLAGHLRSFINGASAASSSSMAAAASSGSVAAAVVKITFENNKITQAQADTLITAYGGIFFQNLWRKKAEIIGC